MWYSFAKKFFKNDVQSQKPTYSVDKIQDIQAIVGNAIAYFRSAALINDKPLSQNISSRKEYDIFYKSHKDIFFRDAAIERLSSLTNCDSDVTYYDYPGYCDICDEDTTFIIDSVWTTHTEGVACSKCLQNSRYRHVYKEIKDYYKPGMKVYISEQITPFFSHVKKLIPDIIGSEFIPFGVDTQPGIRHEDAENLTFSDKSLDIYISNDVLEHVFDYKRAFSEASRVLKDNGVFIFHIPFYYNEITKLRAQREENGAITFLDEPIYHGNPLAAEGSLWVNDFGWDIFDALKASGFAEAYATLRNDVRRGFFNESALVFIAKN